jgi:hypothetical protein
MCVVYSLYLDNFVRMLVIFIFIFGFFDFEFKEGGFVFFS